MVAVVGAKRKVGKNAQEHAVARRDEAPTKAGDEVEVDEAKEVEVEGQNVWNEIAGLCETDVREVHEARQPTVPSEPVLWGNEARQRPDDVPQHTEL